MLINYNGQILPESEAKVGLNRAMKYGDGVFESIRIIQGKIIFWEDHIQRLLYGLNYLEIQISNDFVESLYKASLSLIETLNINRGGRLRIQVFRGGKGKYSPERNASVFVIEAEPLESNGYAWNEKGLKIGLAQSVVLNTKCFVPIKSLNAIPYIKAAMESSNDGLDEVILLNEFQQIAEASSSNVFYFIDGKWKTPALNQACLPGVFRKKLIQNFKELGVPLEVGACKPTELEKADEIFLCNAIQGIRWIGSYKKSRYFHRKIDEIKADFYSAYAF